MWLPRNSTAPESTKCIIGMWTWLFNLLRVNFAGRHCFQRRGQGGFEKDGGLDERLTDVCYLTLDLYAQNNSDT